MKCKIVPVVKSQDVEASTKVEVKLHRHKIIIEGLSENNAYELEELLNRTTKIKVRRYENGKDSKKV